MEYEKSSSDNSDSSSEKDNAPTVAFGNINKINDNKINFNNKFLQNNFKLQISQYYINNLKQEHYINIIKFIMNSCDLTIKDNFSYKNDIFKIKKKKLNNLIIFIIN